MVVISDPFLFSPQKKLDAELVTHELQSAKWAKRKEWKE